MPPGSTWGSQDWVPAVGDLKDVQHIFFFFFCCDLWVKCFRIPRLRPGSSSNHKELGFSKLHRGLIFIGVHKGKALGERENAYHKASWGNIKKLHSL